MTATPTLPFPGFKWRWLSVAPTESLLAPPVFLGVLRVLARHEEEPPSDPRVIEDLRIVGEETKSPVDLARTPERNLIRNSGQYWKGTGLLVPDRGEIRLTPLGRKIAVGEITQGEFAAIMVQQTVLPNPITYSETEVAKWVEAGLEIRPLSLILEVVQRLGWAHGGIGSAFITPSELIRICIPMSGTNASAESIAAAISEHREGLLDVSGWPNCIPEVNDRRLAKEFLLFLAHYGLLRRIQQSDAMDDEYALDDLADVESTTAKPVASMFTGDKDPKAIVASLQRSSLPSIMQRERGTVAVILRPGQQRFRRNVLDAYANRCFLTGEAIEEVLEAAHIVPVNYDGADTPDNGICLRMDIHRLFDSGGIRLRPDGTLHLSDQVRESGTYSRLPGRVDLPHFINAANIRWRDTYL